MEDREVHIESFAAWMLAAQLMMSLSGGVTDAVNTLRDNSAINNLSSADKIVEVDKMPAGTHATTEAFHFEDDDHIYVNKNSEVYKAAQRGDRVAIIKLASIIAHEQTHVMGGDEHAAYTQQLKTLRYLAKGDKAVQNVIDGVQRSAQSVGINVR